MIDKVFVGPSEMTLCLTKGWNLRYVIMYNVIWANQKTKSFVYRWLHAHAMFVPTFVGASDVIEAFC